MPSEKIVLITGGGETASAIACYLQAAKIGTVMVLPEGEMHLRRPVCFSETAFSGSKQIGENRAVLVRPGDVAEVTEENPAARWRSAVLFHIRDRSIPVLLAGDVPDFQEILRPAVVVRTSTPTDLPVSLEKAGRVIALFPLHQPGSDCHLAVETRKNSRLGELTFEEIPGRPAMDYRLFKDPFSEIYSPLEGVFTALKNIGDSVRRNEALGKVDEVEIRSPYQGQIWGLLHSGKIIHPRQPMALICEGPAGEDYLHFDFSHRAAAGTVLREVLKALQS